MNIPKHEFELIKVFIFWEWGKGRRGVSLSNSRTQEDWVDKNYILFFISLEKLIDKIKLDSKTSNMIQEKLPPIEE